MKRLLFALLCALLFSTSYAAYTKQYQATVGIPFILDPAIDIGSYHEGVENMTGFLNTYDDYSYAATDFVYTTINYTGRKIDFGSLGTAWGSGQYYEITPQKAGVSTFRVKLSTIIGGALHTGEEIHYTIYTVDVTDISIPENMTLSIGESYTFSPIITHSLATPVLTWTSSNSSVVSVDNNGTITAVSFGTATITCTAHNGVSTQCEINVSPLWVNSVQLNKTEAELITGEQMSLQAFIQPEDASIKDIIWSSSNEAVAVVNESGLVTAVGAGLCNITATTKDGSELSASCLVNVLGNVLYCEDLGAVPGATVTLPIMLTNADAIQGFEFELVLPEGVSVETDGDGKLAATLSERFNTTGLDGARQENGSYKFVFTSTSRILGKEGAIVYVPLVVAEDAAIGSYDITIKDVELVKYGTSTQIHHGDRVATLTIKEMTLGDVNGDGRVSVADAISIINYVLGRAPVSFITKAADVNGDEDISLADAVAVVDIILGRSGGNVKALMQKLMTLDPQ